MTVEDTSESNTPIQSGARFYRCALQVNPHLYEETFRGKDSTVDSLDYAQQIIEKAVDVGVEVLAITNHNNVDDVRVFRSAASDRPVHILPGFELTSSEGVHVLCIFASDTPDNQLGRYLGEFGIRDTKASSAPCAKTFSEILKITEGQGGITIAAHVTNDNGLFKVLSGQPRIKAWQDKNLLAIQIPGVVDDLPRNYLDIVQNRNSEYRRVNALENTPAVAVVNAKDIVNPEQLDLPEASCWIKMQEVTIDGLRQAFLDPNSRIRLNPKEGTFEFEDHMKIVSIKWEGGFLNGMSINLNSNLNVLIGGRGTGKSTVIESIRSALGLKPLGDEARKAHDGIVRQVLRNGTKISLLVRTQRPKVQYFRIEQTIPNPPLVRDIKGEVLHRTPTDILPRVEAYGQHEISELARNPEKLIHLLDRFVVQKESLTRRKASVSLELSKNRSSLNVVREEIESIEERLAGLPGLEETLMRFQEVGLEERLKEQSLLVREERVLNSIHGRVTPFREVLDTLRKELPIDVAFLSQRALMDLPGRDILFRLTEILNTFGGEVERIVRDLDGALEELDRGVGKVQATWDVRHDKVQAEYENILRELQKSRVDGEEFIRLRRRIEMLRPLQERLALLQKMEQEHVSHRRTLLAEWEDLKAQKFRFLDEAARKVSTKLRDRVQVSVTSAGDREPLFTLLREGISGRISEAIEKIRNVSELSLTQFVATCRAGVEDLHAKYGIIQSQAERLVSGGEEMLMKIEELELDSVTVIRLNTAAKGNPPMWHDMEDLSTGQRATAVLLLLLLEASAPLIVDQPEDDLDNRFITEGIVPRMRTEKQLRQFIFSTHNANIPVLGDAELIIGLSPSREAGHEGAQISREHSGSIDSPTVRELVEEILEGGREAFETRRRKYGF